MQLDKRTDAGVRVTATAIVAALWLILVNALFFWDRISGSSLLGRLLERIGS